jgi:hemolysin III
VLGVGLGIAAAVCLAVVAVGHVSLYALGSLGLYGSGLVAMLLCSALYNFARYGQYAALLRRFDHAVIYIMIAATYSPLAAMAMDAKHGQVLFVFVWLVALIGASVKLGFPDRFERVSLVAYVLLGWTFVLVLGPLRKSIPASGLLLLGIGCGLYSFGVLFHLWRRLPYHNAIWHAFVLAAAACHYAAIFILTIAQSGISAG